VWRPEANWGKSKASQEAPWRAPYSKKVYGLITGNQAKTPGQQNLKNRQKLEHWVERSEKKAKLRLLQVTTKKLFFPVSLVKNKKEPTKEKRKTKKLKTRRHR